MILALPLLVFFNNDKKKSPMLPNFVFSIKQVIVQTGLQQYVNQELPDVQAGFRKGRGTRDEIANIC